MIARSLRLGVAGEMAITRQALSTVVLACILGLHLAAILAVTVVQEAVCRNATIPGRQIATAMARLGHLGKASNFAGLGV